MLWILCSLLCCGLIARELLGAWRGDRPDPVYPPYVIVLTLLAAGFAWPPFSTWQFERFLEQKARLLTEGRKVSVHCNTLFDSLFDPEMLAAGHANLESGKIVIQTPWCGVLRSYLDAPEDADGEAIFSLSLFTHEVMHIRGERNEAATECQAIQYYARMARLLGVPGGLADAHAQHNYREIYLVHRSNAGDNFRHYFSSECAPGKALDLRLSDSVW
ncbi:MAG: hypothetical protein JNN30_12565 [Rhodanobacteraceae bacterium]|nr:hypothetical protein [Rhodanobacteraceae bacterium]